MWQTLSCEQDEVAVYRFAGGVRNCNVAELPIISDYDAFPSMAAPLMVLVPEETGNRKFLVRLKNGSGRC